jgi:hypothetical protein
MSILASVESVVSAINTAINVGATLIQAGKDAAPVAKLIYDTFIDKKEVTQAELEAFQAETDRLSEELQAPLPPES